MKNINLNERIIFALDVPNPDEAKQWVRKLDGDIKFFKVGLELFLAGWWDIVDFIIDRGNQVMLDLKFYDIPETVHLAIQQVKHRGVSFATIHGDDAIVKAAVAAKGNVSLLAVTVLTSFDENDMKKMGIPGTVQDLVMLRAENAISQGCDGLVSSAREIAALRTKLGNGFISVTPGIRPSSAVPGEDDQKRVATAYNAIVNGADYLVIGRPIRNANDPIGVIKQLQNEIAQGLNDRLHEMNR